MKQTFLFSLCLIVGSLTAQEFQEISTGAGYNMQSYVNIAEGTQKQVPNNAWDIAFSASPFAAGVFINESVGSATGAASIQAYYTLSEDFSETPDTSTFFQFQLYNTEESWDYGALNEIRSAGNPFDFGWGTYNPVNHEITGSHVFVIELRDGSFLKLQIQSLINGVYTFRYANLDGSNEVSETIDVTEFAGDVLVYYSFNTGETVDVEPDGGFDMVFLRYWTLLEDPGSGDSLQYLVTGILTAPGVETAQADGVDPETVMYQDYAGQMSSDPEIIGHDWKFFDLGNFMWVIPDDLVYFVRTADDRVWKIQFIDFEGSSTGTTVFEKTDLGIISAVTDPHSPFAEFDVYPNPATDHVHVLFSLKENVGSTGRLELIDASGRLVDQHSVDFVNDMNEVTLLRNDLEPGLYLIRLHTGRESITGKVYFTR